MATGVADCNVAASIAVATESTGDDHFSKPKIASSVTTDLDYLGGENSSNNGGGNGSTPTLTSTATASKTSPASERTTGGALDNLYFFEDEIYRIDKKGRIKFGLVVETSETYSGDEEDDFDDLPSKGEIRVAWHPDGKEEIQPEGAVGLADRTIMPADVVRRLVPGKDTQRGYCRDINMRADVRITGTNYVVKNVDAERFRLLTNWQLDTAVCLDSWVGSIKAVDETVVLKSTYGARFEVSSSGLYGFRDVNCLCRRGIFNSLTLFFPGQVITGRLHSLEPVKMLTPDIELKKNKKGKLLTGRYTVESITTDSVWVRWQCKALSEDCDVNTHEIQQPKQCVAGEDLQRLKRLNLFESCMQQIDDRNYLKLTESDEIIKKSEWEKEQAIKFKLLQKQQKELEASKLNIFPTNIASGASTASNNHHYEKLKKKLHLLDADKNMKSKKFSKSEKNKEKLQNTECKHDTNLITTKSVDSTIDLEVKPQSKNNSLQNEGWISEGSSGDDGDDYDIDDGIAAESDDSVLHDADDARSTATTISTCSSPTPRSSPKHPPSRWKKNKHVSKKLKKITSSGLMPTVSQKPKVGSEIVVESLLLYSTATVVWQDGSIESGIPSTQLYPIHHLDTHEFFPGDFVISGKEDSDASYRDYGVVQSVDHQGRIARVKWFTTYTSADEAKPIFKGETEMSVYDLKDHPDFQYRPGIMVIRVANFVGEDATCTAGQIIDNYTDGRVKVWWVDGHVSMCWPQDLFEVGQYDQTDLGGNESDDSWETESENSELGCSSPKLTIAESHILSNIERACVAIARLEEFFVMSPNLQSAEVMRKLLVVYKGCRYLDRLLNTNFFHENNFMGLVERVRKGGTQTISERAQDRKKRLFNDIQPTNSKQQPQAVQKSPSQDIVTNKTDSDYPKREHNGPKVLFNIPPPLKYLNSESSTSISGNIGVGLTAAHKRKTSPKAANAKNKRLQEAETVAEEPLQTVSNAKDSDISTTRILGKPRSSSPLHLENTSTLKAESFMAEKNQLLTSAIMNIEKAFEKSLNGATFSHDDSGNYSRNENCDGSSTSYASSSDLNNVEGNNYLPYKANEDQKSVSCSSIELTEDSAPEVVCVRLCSLLKDQLLKCISEIRVKYYKEDNLNLSEVFDFIVENEDSKEKEEKVEVEEELIPKSGVERCESVGDATATDKKLSAMTLQRSMDADKDNATTEGPEFASATSLTCVPCEHFQVLPSAPKTHKFHLTIFHPNNTQQYYKAVHREHRMLKTSLPPGVWVRVFEDRMDLVSVMIEGPKKTPYEDGMFFFDIQLGREYPKSPPLCQYISYCSDRLNPNLYEDGKVCVSLLGTWTGRDSEVWGPNSTLLQVIVSIQGLILVAEPYFNEAGYEKQKGTQQGIENSRMYNEMVIIKMVQATSKLLQSPPDIFRKEIIEHYKSNGDLMYKRIKGWMELSKAKTGNTEQIQLDYPLPEFPLVPASRGFCLTLAGLLQHFQTKLGALSKSYVNESHNKGDRDENPKQ